MHTRIWVRVLAAALVAGVMAVALGVASAPAGNRDPLSELAVVPGLDEVTGGQGVALTASFVNRQDSTYTMVRYQAPIPAGATFKKTDCPQSQTELIPAENPTLFVCHWGKLFTGQTANVAYVLQTPSEGSTFTTSGTWFIKEGSQSKPKGGPDTFPTNQLSVPLLAGDDKKKAAGYALGTCTDPSQPTIATNPVLAEDNTLTSSACIPNLPLTTLGLVTTITERARTESDPGITEVSDICMPAPTFGCAPGYTPFVFSTPATFTFVMPTPIEPIEGITQVFEDGVLVSNDPTVDPHVVSITPDDAGNTTVVVSTSDNGGWAFG